MIVVKGQSFLSVIDLTDLLTTMLQGVVVYLCSHKVEVKLSTSEPKQKGMNVGKGLIGRMVGRQEGEVRQNALCTCLTMSTNKFNQVRKISVLPDLYDSRLQLSFTRNPSFS